MNDKFWKQFKPIPGFDCVEMKRKAQLRVYCETRGMSPRDLVKYFQRRAEERAARAGAAAESKAR